MMKIGNFASQLLWRSMLVLATVTPASAQEGLGELFKSFPGWRLECAEATYSVDKASRSVEFCLPLANASQVRCEIALHVPDIRNKPMRLTYDFMLGSKWTYRTDWIIINQIHSRPDAGEAWRCPLLSMEVVGRTLRMYSRSDPNKITDTSKSTCTGSTIRTQEVFQGAAIERGVWTRMSIDLRLALDAGYVTASKDGSGPLGTAKGATTYNDVAPPYIKFGIYKQLPRTGNDTLCVRYRNIRLQPS